MTSDQIAWKEWPVIVHSARTAVAAVASVLVARLFLLPETYWAAVTTLMITQSSLGAALAISWQPFLGTLIGAILGAIVASYFGADVLVFGASVLVLGLLSPIAHADRSGYRFGGITLVIVLLIPRAGPAWQVAFHRFAEVSIGIGVALILAVLWPVTETTPQKKAEWFHAEVWGAHRVPLTFMRITRTACSQRTRATFSGLA